MDWFPVVVAGLSLFRVIDGDTVGLPNGQTVRMYGYNTPELTSKCEPERQKARLARDRLVALIKSSKADPVLTVNTKQCAYSRPCAVLLINGKDVAQIMIAEGLAEPMLCKTSCPKPKDWCTP